MDWEAKTYIDHLGKKYRIKVFENTVWVEQQPGGRNLQFDRKGYPVWDSQNWNQSEITKLIATYEKAITGNKMWQYYTKGERVKVIMVNEKTGEEKERLGIIDQDQIDPLGWGMVDIRFDDSPNIAQPIYAELVWRVTGNQHEHE